MKLLLYWSTRYYLLPLFDTAERVSKMLDGVLIRFELASSKYDEDDIGISLLKYEVTTLKSYFNTNFYFAHFTIIFWCIGNCKAAANATLY